jgi:hypothetical protein
VVALGLIATISLRRRSFVKRITPLFATAFVTRIMKRPA